MVKRITFIAAVLLTVSGGVCAATLEEAVDKAVERLSVTRAVDMNVLRFYRDWGYIDEKYRASVAGALCAGLLCPDGNTLNPKSDDLTPLIRGLVRFGISSNSFNVVQATGAEGININPETIFISGNNVSTGFEPDKSKLYYAVVNDGMRAYIVWEPTDVTVHYLFKGKLYLQEGDRLILLLAQRQSDKLWLNVSDSKYTIAVTDGGLDLTDLNTSFLDREIYILGDLKDNGEIRADYFKAVE